MRKIVDSLLQLFYLFFQPALWIEIANDRNRFRIQILTARAEAVRAKQKKKRALNTYVTIERVRDIKARRR